MALRTPLTVSPHMYIGDATGRPLDLGAVYFGEPDKDPEFYPINIFSNDELTIPIAQPIRTKGGYLSDKGDMVEVHATELIYSVKVLDQYGRKIFYKGQSMRSTWNDDVIIRIKEAVEQSQQIATDIANDAIVVIKSNAENQVNAAINDISAVGANQNGWTDLLIATADGGNQRNLNSKAAFEYANINALLADETISADKTVRTSGYYAKDDGGGAKYKLITTTQADADNITYWTAGDIKNHYAFKVKNNLVAVIVKQSEYRLEQFGAIADGVSDTVGAWEVAFGIYLSGVGIYQSSPTIRLKNTGVYYCSRLLNLKHTVKIYCDSSGSAGGASAVVKFAAGSSGFIVNRYNTLNATTQTTPTTGADASLLTGFTIQGARGTPDVAGGHGVWLRSRAVLRDMEIKGFEGNGVNIVASSYVGLIEVGNANCYTLDTMRIVECANGVYVKGADANAGNAIGLDTSHNRGWGILDESFLGNSWLGCHSGDNGAGHKAYVTYEGKHYQAHVTATLEQLVSTIPGTNAAVWIPNIPNTGYASPWVAGKASGYYKSGGGYAVVGLNNRSTFTGCYSEGGQGFTQGEAQHALFVGGFLLETKVVGSSAWLEGEFGRVKAKNGFIATDYDADNKGVAVTLGGNAANQTILDININRETNWVFKGGNNGSLAFSFANSYREPLKLIGINNIYGFEPLIDTGRKRIEGESNTTALIEAVTWTTANGTQVPTSGFYTMGSKVYTHRPMAGDYIGVICTVNGEAGSTAVFKKFGAIEA